MRTFFISGSAFYVFLQIGALRYVREWSDFQIYVGTSSGSYLSLAMVLEWNPSDLIDWMISDYNQSKSDLSYSFLRLLTSGYLVSNPGRAGFISRMISNSPLYKRRFTGMDPTKITFMDLHKAGARIFICNTVLKDYYKMILLSKWTSPDLPVFTAVTASMALPPIFEPVNLPGTLLPIEFQKMAGQETENIEGTGLRAAVVGSYQIPSEIRCIDGGFIADYLTSSFDPDSDSYYKQTYPNIEIPIDLKDSWGCLQINSESLNGVSTSIEPSAWSFWTLIQFIPDILTFIKAMIVHKESLQIIQDRTWLVSSSEIVVGLPSILVGRTLYELGYVSAQLAGKRGL